MNTNSQYTEIPSHHNQNLRHHNQNLGQDELSAARVFSERLRAYSDQSRTYRNHSRCRFHILNIIIVCLCAVGIVFCSIEIAELKKLKREECIISGAGIHNIVSPHYKYAIHIEYSLDGYPISNGYIERANNLIKLEDLLSEQYYNGSTIKCYSIVAENRIVVDNKYDSIFGWSFLIGSLAFLIIVIIVGTICVSLANFY